MNDNKTNLRNTLSNMLGIPEDRVPLDPRHRGSIAWDGLVIEKWVWTSEQGSKVPSVLYRPAQPVGRMPAMVITCGHGGSKSHWQYTYVPQLYARLGVATLVLDPIGEEERHVDGKLGTRAHDPEDVHKRADEAGRLIMGKLVFDTMRGIDFLESRDDIDPNRIGVAGNSLGGAKAGWVTVLDTRIKLALISGWTFDDLLLAYGKFCTRIPNQRMRNLCSWAEYLCLAGADCAVLILNGDADVIIDKEDDGALWTRTRQLVDSLKTENNLKQNFAAIDCWFESQGGHRPYHGYTVALEWLHKYIDTPGRSMSEKTSLPSINGGKWCDAHNIKLEKLYGTDLHDRGCTLPDMNIRPVDRTQLACLEPHEVGHPDFTIEGWLEAIR